MELNLTIKESILKSLEDIGKPMNYSEVYKHILKKRYCNFAGLTPDATVSAFLTEFITKGDTRVGRKKEGRFYYYYLTKNEPEVEISIAEPTIDNEDNGYLEKHLHEILTTYLKSKFIYSKTILQQESNKKDKAQTWTHPDIVGFELLKLKNDASKKLLKSIGKVDTFKLSSYELKREIKNDVELKAAYFQAVANSSWANFGYLVVLEFSNTNLIEEMERLNESFGIGIIQLNPAIPYESKILFPSRLHTLNFRTIDKLCENNPNFKQFIVQTEKLINAEDYYYEAVKKEFESFCDKYFNNEEEAVAHCEKYKIPYEKKDKNNIF